MTLLRTQLGNTLRGHRLRQRRTLRDVSGAARVGTEADGGDVRTVYMQDREPGTPEPGAPQPS